MLSALRRDKVDLSGLKMIIGGSVFPPSLARSAFARGMDVFSAYGQSESGPMLTGAHLEIEAFRKRFRRGVALPHDDRQRRASLSGNKDSWPTHLRLDGFTFAHLGGFQGESGGDPTGGRLVGPQFR